MNVRRPRVGHLLVGLVTVALSTGCGGGSPPPKSPPSSDSDHDGTPDREGPSRAEPTPTYPASPYPVGPAQPGAAGVVEIDDQRQAARLDVERAGQELESGLGDCAKACRALRSMERATVHLCDLATDLEDRRRCEDAKSRILKASDRIRSSCGVCPDGRVQDRVQDPRPPSPALP